MIGSYNIFGVPILLSGQNSLAISSDWSNT